MKKVLIISYFYPPSNFVGGERTAFWAKHLHEFGYYPIVITRRWNQGQIDLVDKIDDNTLKHDVYDTHEVYQLPFRYSLRDRCANYKLLRPLQKALTLWELIFSNFFVSSLPYSNFYTFSKRLLKENKDIEIVIASGRPFQSFFIGHKLKKKFPITWIPDYRDEWNTTKVKHSEGIIHGKLIQPIERKSELKWTKNADLFITVSDRCMENIQEFIGMKGQVVKNGYEKLMTTNKATSTSSDVLELVYVGTLYSYQKIEMIIKAAQELSEDHRIKLTFIGSEILADQYSRLQNLCAGSENVFEFIPRLPKDEMLTILQKMDLGVLTNYENLEGCLPAKVYDYYAAGITTFLCPNDNGLMEEFINNTNSGYTANSQEECLDLLRELVIRKNKGQQVSKKINFEAANQYSRHYQTQMLGIILSEFNRGKTN